MLLREMGRQCEMGPTLKLLSIGGQGNGIISNNGNECNCYKTEMTSQVLNALQCLIYPSQTSLTTRKQIFKKMLVQAISD